jgi:hypothetical protein
MKSGLDIFFTQLYKPWANAYPGNYWVGIYDAYGNYQLVSSAPKGYISIDLPPGRYLVGGTYYGRYPNFDTNVAIVNVCCDKRTCVTLIPLPLHYCASQVIHALELIHEYKLAPELTKLVPDAIKALKKISEAIPKEYQMLPVMQDTMKPVRDFLKRKKK